MPLTLTASPTDTVGITDVLTERVGLQRGFANTVGITDTLVAGHPVFFFEEVGIEGELTVAGDFIQYDTWRPTPNPTNTLVLLCRTPEGVHDTDYSQLSLWTVHPLGTSENPEIAVVADNGFGWDSYGHPEWSPDGKNIVVWVETATEWKLMLLNASGFGGPV